MPKCRDNRKARAKRDKKNLLQLANKRLAPIFLDGTDGRTPETHEIKVTHVVTKTIRGKRYFTVHKCRYIYRRRGPFWSFDLPVVINHTMQWDEIELQVKSLSLFVMKHNDEVMINVLFKQEPDNEHGQQTPSTDTERVDGLVEEHR